MAALDRDGRKHARARRAYLLEAASQQHRLFWGAAVLVTLWLDSCCVELVAVDCTEHIAAALTAQGMPVTAAAQTLKPQAVGSYRKMRWRQRLAVHIRYGFGQRAA